jgi:hypothetical protein
VAEVWRDPDDDFDWDRRIRPYYIGYTWQDGDAVLFTEATVGFILTSGGFAYLPDGPDAVDTDGSLNSQHLGGPWYAWT